MRSCTKLRPEDHEFGASLVKHQESVLKQGMKGEETEMIHRCLWINTRRKIQANSERQGCEKLGSLVSFILKMFIYAQESVLKHNNVGMLITYLYK